MVSGPLIRLDKVNCHFIMIISCLDCWQFIMARIKGIIKFAYVRHFLAGCELFFITPTAWYYIKSLGQTEVLKSFYVELCSKKIHWTLNIERANIDDIKHWWVTSFLQSLIGALLAHIMDTFNLAKCFTYIGYKLRTKMHWEVMHSILYLFIKYITYIRRSRFIANFCHDWKLFKQCSISFKNI